MSKLVLLSNLLGSFVLGTVTIKDNLTTEKVVGGIIGLVLEIAKYTGYAVVAIGVFNVILAFKDENSEAQSRGIKMCIVGVALIGMRALLRIVGLIA